ncbi:hypothetical protein M408DRAFT_302014 [Serendipita vermifera MAFF 305830]|uniref:Vps72/YL1 C-terminal domain-containing protein n=1 Tax=Serendipita vermifera MAFF 305830 TaxID=933852 RepID=A0A0C2WWG6_SERVB|nr:hypothetical protein M408DRAFT_302014 [Serendipita vermifera MAFF 305830]
MPPKGWRKGQPEADSGVTLPEQLSFMHIPKPFKNPAYTKNATRRTQTLKTLLSREKERDKAARAERSKLKGGVDAGDVKMEIENVADNTMDAEDRMDVDAAGEKRPVVLLQLDEDELAEGLDPDDVPSYFSIEAPPSFLPPKRYCDITGLEGPYRDPKTGLRYHDLGVYNYIQNLNPATIQAHLSTRSSGAVVIK